MEISTKRESPKSYDSKELQTLVADATRKPKDGRVQPDGLGRAFDGLRAAAPRTLDPADRKQFGAWFTNLVAFLGRVALVDPTATDIDRILAGIDFAREHGLVSGSQDQTAAACEVVAKSLGASLISSAGTEQRARWKNALESPFRGRQSNPAVKEAVEQLTRQQQPAAAAHPGAVAQPAALQHPVDPLQTVVADSKQVWDNRPPAFDTLSLTRLVSPWFPVVTRHAVHEPDLPLAKEAEAQRDQVLQAWVAAYEKPDISGAHWNTHPAAVLAEALMGMMQWKLKAGPAVTKAVVLLVQIVIARGPQITVCNEVAECLSGLGACLKANVGGPSKADVSRAYGVLLRLVIQTGQLTGQVRGARYLGRVLQGLAIGLDSGCVAANAETANAFSVIFKFVTATNTLLKMSYPKDLVLLHVGVVAARKHGIKAVGLDEAEAFLAAKKVPESHAALAASTAPMETVVKAPADEKPQGKPAKAKASKGVSVDTAATPIQTVTVEQPATNKPAESKSTHPETASTKPKEPQTPVKTQQAKAQPEAGKKASPGAKPAENQGSKASAEATPAKGTPGKLEAKSQTGVKSAKPPGSGTETSPQLKANGKQLAPAVITAQPGTSSKAKPNVASEKAAAKPALTRAATSIPVSNAKGAANPDQTKPAQPAANDAKTKVPSQAATAKPKKPAVAKVETQAKSRPVHDTDTTSNESEDKALAHGGSGPDQTTRSDQVVDAKPHEPVKGTVATSAASQKKPQKVADKAGAGQARVVVPEPAKPASAKNAGLTNMVDPYMGQLDASHKRTVDSFIDEVAAAMPGKQKVNLQALGGFKIQLKNKDLILRDAEVTISNYATDAAPRALKDQIRPIFQKYRESIREITLKTLRDSGQADYLIANSNDFNPWTILASVSVVFNEAPYLRKMTNGEYLFFSYLYQNDEDILGPEYFRLPQMADAQLKIVKQALPTGFVKHLLNIIDNKHKTMDLSVAKLKPGGIFSACTELIVCTAPFYHHRGSGYELFQVREKIQLILALFSADELAKCLKRLQAASGGELTQEQAETIQRARLPGFTTFATGLIINIPPDQLTRNWKAFTAEQADPGIFAGNALAALDKLLETDIAIEPADLEKLLGTTFYTLVASQLMKFDPYSKVVVDLYPRTESKGADLDTRGLTRELSRDHSKDSDKAFSLPPGQKCLLIELMVKKN